MPVYPRVCGGTEFTSWPDAMEKGLSPRVRGNLAQAEAERKAEGSIPACAGEPHPGRHSTRPLPVYPRVCGGTNARRRYIRASKGLSPRVRGNPRGAVQLAAERRSIPACAGEPSGKRNDRTFTTVYPRVCGGTDEKGGVPAARQGLSPRVRGNPQGDAAAIRRGRSIPACAGEPPGCALSARLMPVYPRVCGGTATGKHEFADLYGLSPRVRGNRTACATARRTARSIPACAGEPTSLSIWAPPPKVYPRVCGGT